MKKLWLPVALWAISLAITLSIAKADASPGYVGSETCQSCHEGAYSAWAKSHHAKAWMEPSPDTVSGDFNNAVFEHLGRETRFFEENDRYFIETSDVQEGPKVLEITGVGGIAPLQQYLVEIEPGRQQSLDIAWDQVKKRWYHLYPDQKLPPDDAFHWSGPYKNWNARCAECHATGFEKNYLAKERRYQSTQAEIGVGCEACHGPAEEHLKWSEAPQTYAASPFPGTNDFGLLISFSEEVAEREIQQCAGCHSRREPFLDGNPLPGTPYHDSYRLALLRDGLYHADGQILDEVYVYGSFLQSKMYDKGVRCSDCHEPHSASLKATGNAVCTQCHSEAGSDRFPTLTTKAYDDPAHHFHEPGSQGAQCQSCHMIERIYMGIDGRRDHSFRIPRPDMSVSLGTPNACTDCHADKTAAWAAGVLETRFPQSASRGPHFAEAFSAARNDRAGNSEDLIGIAKHAKFPAIVRASAIDLLRTRATPEILKELQSLLLDESPVVREAALSLQSQLPPQERFAAVADALKDPLRSVRIAAARQLIGAPPVGVSEETKRAAQAANKEWQTALIAKLDFPETHTIIGGTALALRNPQAAIRAFQEATNLDAQLVDGWIMQIRIHMALQDFAAAQFTLQKALLANPANPVLLDFKRQFTQQ
ncbi:multiheme c-type cytochrome [Roseibium sp.]|uniref:multiheme c-type cytochrome n=1 Tax=Roseibium sp. TaxID=1936156 RepID=UPI003BAA1EF6